MNSLPKVKDFSYGFERRLVIVPFEQRFVLHKPKKKNEIQADPDLVERLEGEIDGIFAFAIRGLERLRQNNYVFTSSKKSKSTLENYKETINPYLEYANKQLDYDANLKIGSTALREHFMEWCANEGYTDLKKISSKSFWKGMEPVLIDKGIEYKRGKSSTHFVIGLSIKDIENDS